MQLEQVERLAAVIEKLNASHTQAIESKAVGEYDLGKVKEAINAAAQKITFLLVE